MGVLFVFDKVKLDRRVLHCNPERKKRAPVVLNVLCWSSFAVLLVCPCIDIKVTQVTKICLGRDSTKYLANQFCLFSYQYVISL